MVLSLSYTPFTLQLRHPFRLGNGSVRSTTAIMLVTLRYGNFEGRGEASMPPYLGETQESCANFLSKIDLSHFSAPFSIVEILKYLDKLAPGNPAAKAAVDIALHNLFAAIEGRSLAQYLGTDHLTLKPTTCTLGIDQPEVIHQKVKEAADFFYLKIKLGSEDDRRLVESIREVSDKPLYADVNQGWSDVNYALDMAHWLKEKGVLMLEQPFPKEMKDLQYALFEKSPLPLFADESCQRLADIDSVKDRYHGINVKLMKSTGIHEAIKMQCYASGLGLKTMIGCMTETSCATLAAATIAPLFDIVDLDGPWLICNNPFPDPQLVNGCILPV